MCSVAKHCKPNEQKKMRIGKTSSETMMKKFRRRTKGRKTNNEICLCTVGTYKCMLIYHRQRKKFSVCICLLYILWFRRRSFVRSVFYVWQTTYILNTRHKFKYMHNILQLVDVQTNNEKSVCNETIYLPSCVVMTKRNWRWNTFGIQDKGASSMCMHTKS